MQGKYPYQLLDKIISINDISLLQKINDLIGDVDLNEPVFKVSDAQQAAIREGLEDIKHGRLKSDESVNQEIDKWLNG